MQINANGIALEAEETGPADGPPLILIRGLGTQMAHWPKEVMDGFAAAGFRTVIFDNRDTGLSQRCPRPGVSGDATEILRRFAAGEDIPPPYSLDDMARDVIGLMDALGIARAHVFGISMGGAIAQTLAIRHAERLLSASFVMTACRPLLDRADADPATVNDLVASLLAHPQSHGEYLRSQIDEHRRWGSPGYPMPDPDIRAMAETTWARGVDPAGINRQLLATLHAPDRRPALRDVSLPCLVIHGTDDALLPVDLGKEIAAHVPKSEFHAIDGMGHVITPALAPVIVALVADFIARRAP